MTLLWGKSFFCLLGWRNEGNETCGVVLGMARMGSVGRVTVATVIDPSARIKVTKWVLRLGSLMSGRLTPPQYLI